MNEWAVSIIGTIAMILGMFIAWNPFYPIEWLGFIITAIGFLFIILCNFGIIGDIYENIKYAKEEKDEK